jgi:hypothetical protein
MDRPLFLPNARQTNVLLIVGFLSLGYALYIRYLAIEQSQVGLACDAGLTTWLCASRRVITLLFNNGVFGWGALILAGLHFVRPSLWAFALALIFGGLGIVLYNVGLSSIAAALLILSFARPWGPAARQ